jgi:hypothetical protein
MYKKNSINKIKKQNHTHKRTKKRSYGKPSNKKNTKHNKRTQKYGYYNKNNKITKKRVYNKKKKGLVGGASGAAVVVPKIMICTKNFYKYLIPVLTYLQNQNKFLNNTIDVIYANGKNSESLLNQSIKLKSITSGKIKSIFTEAFIIKTTPFIIYIDDDNEIIKSKETQIPEQFGMYLYKYEVKDTEYDLNEEPGINITDTNYKTIINTNSEYKCLCIHLPFENTSICNDIYYNLIKDILLFIKQKFHNNLLTVFDFDNTLTLLHLFKSITKKQTPYTQYTLLKEQEFITAFLNPGDNDELKKTEINKYFGEGNIQKILELFEIIKRPSHPPKPKVLTINDVISDTYLKLKTSYDFTKIIDKGINFYDTDFVFILKNENNEVISIYCIFKKNEIGNAFTLEQYRKKGYSKILVNKIIDYLKTEGNKDNLYYIMTKFEYVKKMWENTDYFFSLSEKKNGKFIGLNHEEYNLDNDMYVLRNNKCSTLYIFHNIGDINFTTYKNNARKYIENVVPIHNIIDIDFKDKTMIHNKKTVKISTKYDNTNFFNIINKDFTEITYRFLIILAHGDYENNIFQFGNDNQMCSQIHLKSTIIKPIFIIMATCYSNFFIDYLEKEKSDLISSLSVPALAGANGSNFSSLYASLKFIKELNNIEDSMDKTYSIVSAIEHMQGNQLIEPIDDDNTTLPPIVELIYTFIDYEELDNNLKTDFKALNQNWFKALGKHINDEFNKLSLNNDEFNIILEIEDIKNKFNPVEPFTLDFFKTKFKSFFDKNNDTGINNSNYYLTNSITATTCNDECTRKLFCVNEKSLEQQNSPESESGPAQGPPPPGPPPGPPPPGPPPPGPAPVPAGPAPVPELDQDIIQLKKEAEEAKQEAEAAKKVVEDRIIKGRNDLDIKNLRLKPDNFNEYVGDINFREILRVFNNDINDKTTEFKTKAELWVKKAKLLYNKQNSDENKTYLENANKILKEAETHSQVCSSEKLNPDNFVCIF